jgi:ABC-type spermidine/putrescine transport system permease subunit I
MAESREEKQQRISQELAHAQPQDYAARQLAEYQRIIDRIDREPERRLAWCSFWVSVVAMLLAAVAAFYAALAYYN